MKKIVVVGGGTAGWLTALFVQRTFPSLDITVVESKDIGILGAGEGSTPHLISFLDLLNIPVSDLIQNCDATIKNGIKFTNWKNDEDFYYNSFLINPNSEVSLHKLFPATLSNHPLLMANFYKTDNIKEIDFVAKLSEKNKVPFVFTSKQLENPIFDFNNHSSFSVHFNATKFANRLKEIGSIRGINVIEKNITDVILDKNENVDYLVLDNKEKIYCDFVFDCSGFHRLIIGNKYKSTFNSYNDFIPNDSAIPFFIKMDKEIPPYTEAIAMKYGWMWKIPLQSRYGCGYVYDSSVANEEDIIKEIENHLGFKPEYPRKNKGSFKFNAGYYEEPWIKNCVAIGLSSNFIEPLEATSIWVSIISLQKILSGTEWLFNNNETIRNDFNLFVKNINDEISNFIYFHYMSKRKDTEFWKKFTYDNAPKYLKNKIDIWQYRFPNNFDTSKLFDGHNWMMVGSNIGLLNSSIAKTYFEYSEDSKMALSSYENFKKIQDDVLEECINHNSFLEYFNEN
jgi:tryptophan halogenase